MKPSPNISSVVSSNKKSKVETDHAKTPDGTHSTKTVRLKMVKEYFKEKNMIEQKIYRSPSRPKREQNGSNSKNRELLALP